MTTRQYTVSGACASRRRPGPGRARLRGAEPPAYLLRIRALGTPPPAHMRPATLAPRVATLVLFTLLLVGGTPAVPQDDALERVTAGLEGANPEAVLVDASGRVEIVLFGQGGMFRRAQATHVLRDFFRRYPPDRVAFSEPSSSDDGQTAIGRYWSQSGGVPLNVRVLHRAVDDGWELSSIRIDQRPVVRTSGL